MTFQTPQNVQYMEGHHLIPCTATNARDFWTRDTKSIDCCENIVCLCPNCHRAIHFGDESKVEELIKLLFTIQKEKLSSAGIQITESELLAFYKR